MRKCKIKINDDGELDTDKYKEENMDGKRNSELFNKMVHNVSGFTNRYTGGGLPRSHKV
jgi:hypothetical protein